PRNGPRGWPTIGSQNRESFTPGQMCALQSDTQGGSRMPELGPYGSVRGARGNSRPAIQDPKRSLGHRVRVASLPQLLCPEQGRSWLARYAKLERNTAELSESRKLAAILA